MKETPKGWPRLTPTLFYDDPRAAIDWLCQAFGFEVRIKVEGEDGSIHHSELELGEGLIMVGDTKRRPGRASPRSTNGANTQTVMAYVDDADAHAAQARAAGAKIHTEPTTTDYGEGYWADRSYEAEDLEGHRWWFAERVRG